MSIQGNIVEGIKPTDAVDLEEPPAEGAATPHASSGADPEDRPVGEDLLAETLVEEISIDGMCGVY